jgi:hypothetical protein
MFFFWCARKVKSWVFSNFFIGSTDNSKKKSSKNYVCAEFESLQVLWKNLTTFESNKNQGNTRLNITIKFYCDI